jgi:hypothetical protein
LLELRHGTWAHEQAKSLNTTLDLFYVLLALSVLISLFGMVNTLVLSVFERTREIGMPFPIRKKSGIPLKRGVASQRKMRATWQ